MDSPFKTFPPNINRNLYSDIIHFSQKETPETLLLIVNLIVPKHNPVNSNHVVKVAHFLSGLAHSVNRGNNSVAKLKSVVFSKEGLTNQGLDLAQVTGMTETSRSKRNTCDFFAGISSEVLRSSAKCFPHTRTMDNLDIKVAEVTHHLTQEFIQIEQTCTKHLATEKRSFSEATQLFHSDTISLLTQAENFKHFKKVVAITVGRMIASRCKGASFLEHLLENHYDHPNQDLHPKPAIIFIQKPLYYHEIKNDEMIKILQEIQLDFLMLTAEQVLDKEAFLEDLDKIQNQDCNKIDREAAEQRIEQAVLDAGEYIGHGDYLTFQKFYDAKRLMQPGVTALERLEFLKYFKLANFHMKMNKVRNLMKF